jgi:predicted nucleic acid-binding protein
MIVADANLIAYLILPGERTREAEAVLETDPVWVVPVLWASEMRRVLGHYVRAGQLSIAQASAAMDRASGLIDGREGPVESREVLTLAVKSGCSTYDCEYVSLAMSLGVGLVTSDKALLRAFPGVAVTPEAFCAVPRS